MEIININGKGIYSEDDFFNSLCQQVPDFGIYFGRNLDALNDYIDILAEKKIIWANSILSKERLGDFIESIIDIINRYNESIRKLPDFKKREIILVLS